MTEEINVFYASKEYHAITRAIINNPITPDGFTFKTRSNIALREFMDDPAILLVWSFLKKVERTKTIQTGLTSYTMKHWLEEAQNTYISNGAFIIGAILSDCQVKCVGKNALFNIAKESFIQNL